MLIELKTPARQLTPTLTFGLLLCASVGFGTMAFGADVEHFWHALVPSIVNFVILLASLIYFGRTPIQRAFENRAKDIERTIKKNNEIYTKTLDEFDRYGKMMDSLQDEREELIQDAHKEGKRMVEKSQQSAKKTVESYTHDVTQSIALETAELKRKLALDLMDMAMQKLSQEIQQSSTKLDHFYVDQFKKLGNKTNVRL